MLPKMFIEQWLDIAQTSVLITIALALIYALRLLRIELRNAAQALRDVLSAQREFEERFERVWKRIDAIELRQGVTGNIEGLSKLKRLSDAIEQIMKNADSGDHGEPPQP